MHTEILTRLIEECVSVLVNDVPNSEPVGKARAEVGRICGVHWLVYELETGRPKDLKLTKFAQA